MSANLPIQRDSSVIEYSAAVGANEGDRAQKPRAQQDHPVGRSMNAVYIDRTGDLQTIQHGRIACPVPAPGQVLIRVGAAAMHSVDWEKRSSIPSTLRRFPDVVGNDVAGTVVTKGIGVRRFMEGDRVWGSNQGMFGRQGTFAEHVAIDEKWLYPTPEEQSDVEAAAGATAGITACLGLLHSAQLKEKEVVLVHGGSSEIRSAIIQLAKACGARVAATTDKQVDLTSWRRLPADRVLDCQSTSFETQVREFVSEFGAIDVCIGEPLDVSLQCVVRWMRPGGRIVLPGGLTEHDAVPQVELQERNLSLLCPKMSEALPDLQRKYAMTLNEYYSAGKWRPWAAMTLGFSQVADGQHLQTAGSHSMAKSMTGNIVVVPGL